MTRPSGHQLPNASPPRDPAALFAPRILAQIRWESRGTFVTLTGSMRLRLRVR